MKKSKIIKIKSISDDRGSLYVVEKILPFEVKRVYWIYGYKGKIRGGHRHAITFQALICMNGVVNITIKKGNQSTSYLLDNPKNCLILNPDDWHTMEFNDDAILLVFASTYFDQSDYIDEKI